MSPSLVVPVVAVVIFLAYLAGLEWCERSKVKPLRRELKLAKRKLEAQEFQLRSSEAVVNGFANPQCYPVVGAEADNAPDPAGVRAAFFKLDRLPLFEVTRPYAEQLKREGFRVFLHPFDPIEVGHFDSNGFQCWAKEGQYRIEGVRFYTDFPAIPADYLRKLIGKYDDQNEPA